MRIVVRCINQWDTATAGRVALAAAGAARPALLCSTRSGSFPSGFTPDGDNHRSFCRGPVQRLVASREQVPQIHGKLRDEVGDLRRLCKFRHLVWGLT